MGRTVFSMNFSGHSQRPFEYEFGIAQFTNDVLHFLDKHHQQRVAIFGYSMGGYVALWFAHRHPDRVDRIVTLGTKFDWDPVSAQRECRKLNAEKIEEKVPAFARILQTRHSPELWKKLLSETADMMLSLGDHPLLTDKILTTLNNPVTIALGDEDDMADRAYSEHVAATLPHGQFILFENTPHPIEKVELKKIAGLITK